MTMNSPLINALQWRYATKQFDATKKVSDADLNELLEVLRLTPSSFGLQAWHFLVVTDPALREQLVGHSWNQRQVADASHLIVLCAARSLTDADLQAYVQTIAEQRGVPADAFQGYLEMMRGSLLGRSQPELQAWSSRQVYIALGQLMTACALKQIDSCPMEGFDAAAYDKLLGLEGTNWTSCVLLPVGYRSADDKYATLPKVRYSIDQLIERR
jgi:nitroreductase